MKFTLFSEAVKQRLLALVNVIWKDWPWKVAALLLAMFLFFGIRQSMSYTQTLNLLVETELDSGKFSLKRFEPNTVRVTFRGSEAAIRRLSLRGSEPPRVRLHLTQPPVGSGAMRIPISANEVICESDLRVESIEPQAVMAQFDQTETRYLNVDVPILRGVAATDKMKVTLEPSYVEVSGPSERLDDLVERSVNLSTEVLDVAGRRESFTTAVRVQAPDTRSSWTLRPETVMATVEIAQEEGSRTFASLPVRVLQPADGQLLRTVPMTVSVSITGAPEELQAIEEERVLAIVNPQYTSESIWPVEAKVEALLPPNRRMKNVTITPSHVNLYQKEQPTKVAPVEAEMDKTK